MSAESSEKPVNFIRAIINEDVQSNKHGGQVVTRFPPEPNGYLHIGHAKSICLNFGIARDYLNASCHLRFDDTNPSKEDQEFVDSIMQDVQWLGFSWGEHLYHASDYFPKIYQYSIDLIKQGKAYVCSLTGEQIRQYRGTLTEPGKNSPYRDRSVEENLDLFARMKKGEFDEGSHVLRAKIDMTSPNINLRDPALYRIRKVPHQRTGDAWCIYPMYDYTHPISDALECITHSLCTLEFEDHRPLYDWVLDQLDVPSHPQQIEFSRLNLEYCLMSKRKLTELVQGNHVKGWDDPRMPTIAGLRRRGFTPASIRDFCDRIGITKSDNIVEMAVLENCIREDLDANAHRAMAVLHPLKVVITNYPADKTENLTLASHPKEISMGARDVPFCQEILIDRADFERMPPPKYKRLSPGEEVRLRGAYVIRCDEVLTDAAGAVTELRCSVDLATLGKNPEGRKVKGVIHWVSARHGIPAEIRLYDRLFISPNPEASAGDASFLTQLNPDSFLSVTTAVLEPSLMRAQVGTNFQFEREGYFTPDLDSSAQQLVFNRTVTLRDTWARSLSDV